MAFVFEKNGYWYVGYTDHVGKPRKRKTTFAVGLKKDRNAALELSFELARKFERVRFGVESAPIAAKEFRVVVADYLAVHAPTLRSFRDIKQRLTTHVVPNLGEMLLTEIRPADIQALLNQKEKDGLGPQTRQHLLVHISAVFSYAIKQRKWCKENPAVSVAEVFIPPRPPKVIAPQVVVLLIQHVPDRWRGVFAVAAYAGLRKGEVLGLLVEDVDLESMVITVQRSYGGATKGGKVRYVPIAPDLVPYLKVELGRARSRWLFPALDGSMQNEDCHLPRTMRNALKRAGVVIGYDHKCRRKGCGFVERRADEAPSQCPACGFALFAKRIPPDWTFKDLRSTCATLAYEMTGDIRFVKELLGHSDINVTMERYAKMRSAWMTSQASKMSYSNPPYSLPGSSNEDQAKQSEETNVSKISRLPNAR